MSAAEYPRRRFRLHVELYGRRRISRALDRHLGLVDEEPAELDYRAAGMHLGVREREIAEQVAA